MNLAEMMALSLEKEEKERDPERLFVTDVGKCRRQVMYRLTEAEKNTVSMQTRVNKTIMFAVAEYFESMLVNALGDKVIATQEDVPFADFYNWGGRCDIIADYGGKRIIEVKTVHPNAFGREGLKYTYPEHEYQAAIYDLYLGPFEELPLLVYFDRGGSNTPIERAVDYDTERVVSMMEELDDCREDLPTMPNRLPKVLKVRNYGRAIVLEGDGRCGYCDYSNVCNPDLSKVTYAKRESRNGIWKPTKAADPEVLLPFIDAMLGEGNVQGA